MGGQHARPGPLDKRCSSDHSRLDQRGLEATMYHSRSEMGHTRAQSGLRGQGLLRVVRRANRLSLNCGQLLIRLGKMVQGTATSGLLSVHGQGQRSVS